MLSSLSLHTGTVNFSRIRDRSFHKQRPDHGYNTGNCTSIKSIQHQLKLFERSPQFMVLKVYNRLPLSIRQTPTLILAIQNAVLAIKTVEKTQSWEVQNLFSYWQLKNASFTFLTLNLLLDASAKVMWLFLHYNLNKLHLFGHCIKQLG